MTYGLDQPPAPDSPPPSTVLRDTACSGCSYNLIGLPLAANCPECAMPIGQTLRGRLLPYASPEYRHEVQAGLGLVLNGTLLMIVLLVVTFAVAIVQLGVGARGILEIAQFGISLMILLGYWRYTTPDPGFALTEQSNSARVVARVAVAVAAVCMLITSVGRFMLAPLPGAAPEIRGALAIVVVGAAFLYTIAWLVQFFAIMTYTAWIAGRVPDADIEKKARRYRWLLPVVYLLGSLIVIGPLIALVMYWNLLHKLRRQIQAMG